MYFPINYDNSHWVYGELNLKEWELMMYDSVNYTKDEAKFKMLIRSYKTLSYMLMASGYWETLDHSL